MQTPQILTPTNVNSGPNPATRPGDANAPETPFKDVLSREMSGRGTDTAKPPENTSGQAPSAPAAKDRSQAANAGPTDLPPEEQDPALAASAEVLALVASLTQGAAGTAEAAELPEETATADQLLREDAKANPAAVTTKTDAPAHPLAMGTLPAARAAGAADAAGTTGRAPGIATAMEKQAAAKAEGEPQERKAGSAQEKPFATELAAARTQESARNAAAGQAALNGAGTAGTEAATTAGTNVQPVQHAALNAVQAAAPQTQEKLTPRVGTPAWDQALGQKVVWMVAGEQQSASLTLNPPDLGPLQVVLNVSNSQANATFISAQPEVRQALESALPKLREMLGEAGIQLGQASVNSGTPGQQSAHGEQQGHGTRRAESIDSQQADAPLRSARTSISAGGRGLVDTFA